MEKSWWASKTLWTNLLGIGALLMTGDGPLAHVLAPEEVGMGLGIINMILRAATTQPLQGMGPERLP